MSRIALAGVLLFMLLPLVGCGGPPWVMAQTPRVIHLRWYPDSTNQAQADQVAALHCGHLGVPARLATSAKIGSVMVATYRCE